MVGLPEKAPSIHPFNLLKRISVAGSMIGGMPETQEMLDYCGSKNIAAEVEVIPIQKITRSLRAHAQTGREIPLRQFVH